MATDEEGKYIYDISEVVTIFHGSPKSISICEGVSFANTEVEDKLLPKRIRTLRLSSCLNGKVDVMDNMARTFMKLGTIGEVYAWDGESAFIGSVNASAKLLNIQIGDYNLTIVLNATLLMEYSYSNIELLLENIKDYFISRILNLDFDFDYFDNRDLGLVRYYSSVADGNDYENVSDSNIYFSCWICF